MESSSSWLLAELKVATDNAEPLLAIPGRVESAGEGEREVGAEMDSRFKDFERPIPGREIDRLELFL